eukprot:Plantae.Rhodophyta-Purpureofilum_apyrenoidigerum.ctg11915.p1 GENE.Plantae.Rhodophyta-Purpureofilum_apyrenoidigerum.ctg11915~~Plantae.Rhodophyta-Purpureofilum_apyrenoidigerum.ctg11915.p1  ORF type:complete len:240 (+),score=36.56 Plantae.Rhodophyta-Purpureofilum_apyrenoidigerum.ctg11915:251-970(+)
MKDLAQEGTLDSAGSAPVGFVSTGVWVIQQSRARTCGFVRRHAVTMRARADKKMASLKENVFNAIKGYDKGYGNKKITEDEDDRIDDLIADLEDFNPTKIARDSEYMVGRWRLMFTSSTITRFAKGMSGIHSLLPGGRSIEVEQIIEPEDYRSYIVEKVSYLGGLLKGDALVLGQFRWNSNNKLSWRPEDLKLWFLRFQAESGWRALSALRSMEVTYLDYEVKVERGEVGQVYVWKRVE